MRGVQQIWTTTTATTIATIMMTNDDIEASQLRDKRDITGGKLAAKEQRANKTKQDLVHLH